VRASRAVRARRALRARRVRLPGAPDGALENEAAERPSLGRGGADAERPSPANPVGDAKRKKARPVGWAFARLRLDGYCGSVGFGPLARVSAHRERAAKPPPWGTRAAGAERRSAGTTWRAVWRA